MSERMDGWRECADPVELAAAVAAGVEVQRNWGYDWQPGTNNETAEQFAGCTKANCRYRLPVSWSWSPEPPADVPTGAERYLAERMADPEYRAAYEAAAPVTGDDSEPPEVKRRTRSEVTDDFVEGTRTIREWVNGGGVDGPRLCEELDAWLDYWGGSPVTPTPPPVPPWPDGVLRDAANRLRWIANSGYIEDLGIKRIIRSWADELDATLVPPWPGAVLSGLRKETAMSDERPEWHRHPNGGGWVQDTASVDETAYVGPDAQVSGNAQVCGAAQVYGAAQVFGAAWVYGNAWVYGAAQVCGAAEVYGNAQVYGNARVYGAAQVCGNAWVYGAAEVSGNAWVSAPRHVLTVGPIGSEDQTLTLFRTETGYGVSVGCWHPDGATLDDLTAEVQRRAPDHADEYEAAMALCRVRIEEWEAQR